MKKIFYFLLIVFLEITCGFILVILYYFLATLIFGKDIIHNWINEVMFYVIGLLPPFFYCWMEYSRFKKQGNKSNARIYLSAGITYLVGGLILMLSLAGFYLYRI